MRTSHRILLRIFHDPDCDFEKVLVEFVDRGAPGDRSTACGSPFMRLDRDYIEIESEDRTSYIPYHRITKILYDGHVIWDRDLGERNISC